MQRLVLLSGCGEPEAQRAEQAVHAIFPAATVVRCAWFDQNFSESFMLEGVQAGTIALPVGDVREQFVGGLVSQHVPAARIELLRCLFGEVLDGRNAKLVDGVQRALGRQPPRFGAFAERAAASGVSAPSAPDAVLHADAADQR